MTPSHAAVQIVLPLIGWTSLTGRAMQEIGHHEARGHQKCGRTKTRRDLTTHWPDCTKLAPLYSVLQGLLSRSFRSVANGKMGVGLFSKLECCELRICFIGNEINTSGARHPLAFCCASSRVLFAQWRTGKWA